MCSSIPAEVDGEGAVAVEQPGRKWPNTYIVDCSVSMGPALFWGIRDSSLAVGGLYIVSFAS